MKIFFYIGTDFSKILERKSHIPMEILELNEYEKGLLPIKNSACNTAMLKKLMNNYCEKIEYNNADLSAFLDEINHFVRKNTTNRLQQTFFKKLIICIESGIAHKKHFYITGKRKYKT